MAKVEIRYFDIKDAINLQAKIAEEIGGKAGCDAKFIAKLEDILDKIKDDSCYPNFSDKLAHLICSCVVLRPFLDVNKSTALMLGIFFILLNKMPIAIENFAFAVQNSIILISRYRLGESELKDLIESFLKR